MQLRLRMCKDYDQSQGRQQEGKSIHFYFIRMRLLICTGRFDSLSVLKCCIYVGHHVCFRTVCLRFQEWEVMGGEEEFW